MGKSRSARISKSKDNTQLAVQEHETDSPLVPVNQLKELHTFRPDLVDWTIKNTEEEAKWRRKEISRLNSFMFFGRFLGQICGLLIGLASIGAGAYIAIFGEYPWIGATIAGIGITGLASAFLAYSNRKK